LKRLRKTLQNPGFWSGLAQFSVICVVAASAIWMLSANARREIEALAIANGDSVQWSLAQSEVEFRTYIGTLQDVLLSPQADVQEVRNRFDVFYSRFQTLRSASTFEEVRDMPGVAERLEAIEAYLYTAIPTIDGDDDQLLRSLPDLLDGAKSLGDDVREVSLAGVRAFASEAQSRRKNVAGTLFELGTIMFLLLAIVLAAVAVQLRMMRSSKRQTDAIIGAQNRLGSIISTSLDAILAVDRDGKVLEFNGAAERIFGYSRSEAIGADMANLIIPQHMRAQHDAGMKRHLETGEKRVVGKGLVKLEAQDKTGRVFPVEVSISSADGPEGEIFVSYIRDISNRVAAETELVEARDKALAGEKAKADLLAVMSHEMRTPLNGVLGTLQLLNKTPLDENQRRLAEVMDHSGQLLLEHVNNVLDIARVDAGMAKVSTEEFKLRHLVESVLDGLQTQAAERGNELAFVEVGKPAGLVSGDKSRIRQVLFNLLGNAIKFTQNGKITVEIEADPAGDDVVFRISDTGIGIPSADMGRIFDDFVTLNASYNREVEGTGLGLGIVRRIVSLLDGDISVDSEVGLGSVFTLRLPLPRVSRQAVRRESLAAPSGQDTAAFDLDVLVVEDNETNRMIVRIMLEQLGCSVVEAIDGQEGAEIARTRPFDLILMDISMPKIDGLEATRMIRGREGPNENTRIVAMTAHAFADDVIRFREAGMADVLTKPLLQDELRTMLAQAQVYVSAAAPSQVVSELINALGPDLARELQTKVLNEVERGLSEMKALVQGGGPHSDVTGLAHKLASSAGVVGFDTVRSGLLDIEKSSPSSGQDHLLALVASTEKAAGDAPLL
jgi:PAS domain S-box-containing protein